MIPAGGGRPVDVYLPLPPGALARIVVIALALSLAAACGSGTDDVRAAWQVQPTPAVVGADTTVRLTLSQATGEPLRGAQLRVEGHMTHPGMEPVSASLTDRGDGSYDARVRLTMAGDWVLVATGELLDGRRIVRQTDLAAVEEGR
jgi:nitrogen fixation protein FixH